MDQSLNEGGVHGAQVIKRAAILLKLAGERAARGMSTAEMVGRSGLKRPTAHRLLAALCEEGLLQKDPNTRLWKLGDEIFVLGSVFSGKCDFESMARELTERTSQITGDAALFSLRRRSELVTLFRRPGCRSTPGPSWDPGDRRPIGIGANGIAMLAAMTDDEVGVILEQNDHALRLLSDYSADATWDMIAEARENGFAVARGRAGFGECGLAAVVVDVRGRPTSTLSIVTDRNRLSPAREAEVGSILLEKTNTFVREFRQSYAISSNMALPTDLAA